MWRDGGWGRWRDGGWGRWRDGGGKVAGMDDGTAAGRRLDRSTMVAEGRWGNGETAPGPQIQLLEIVAKRLRDVSRAAAERRQNGCRGADKTVVRGCGGETAAWLQKDVVGKRRDGAWTVAQWLQKGGG